MTTIVLPDVEQLVIDACLGMAELQAIFGTRIYSVAPKARSYPMARVARFGGDPLWGGDPYWVDVATLQFDIWDQRVAVAQTSGEQLRASVAQNLPGVWPLGVVNAVKVTSLVQSSDTDFDPPQARYRFTASVTVHPIAGSSSARTDQPDVPAGGRRHDRRSNQGTA